MSFCQKGLFLESGKGFTVTLHPGECNPPPPPPPPLNTNSLLNPSALPAFRPGMETPVGLIISSIFVFLSIRFTFSFFQPLDNELSAVLDAQAANSLRFRSMADGSNGTVPGLFDAIEGRSAPRSNGSSNIYPYGNVPLSVLQQIPADIKVGGGGAAGASKRPSFYQWPLVGASQAANFFFGNHGRPRFKSLGSRRYEPNGQLTPPSLQQLQQQQQGALTSRDKDSVPTASRRQYFRRNSAAQQQQQMSPEERQSRQEYYLLRQQQLVLQQQQFNQASRFRLFQQQQQQNPATASTPSQWVMAPPQQRQVAANQWRPDAVVEAELPRIQLTSPIRSSIASPDALASNSFLAPSAIATGPHLTTSSPVSSLTTMTIINTPRHPEMEALDPTGAPDLIPAESFQSGDSNAVLAAIEAANLLSGKTPSSNRQMNETVSNSSAPVLDPAGNVSSLIWHDYPLVPADGSIVLAEEIYPNPEQLGQVRDEYWSSKAVASRGKQSAVIGLAPPAPTAIVPTPPAAQPSGLPIIQQYPMVVRQPALGRLLDGSPGATFDHKPTYIPINPADRQSRQLQAHYYAPDSKPAAADHQLGPANHQQRTIT